MTVGRTQYDQFPADAATRRRLGEALDAYYYGEFASMAELLDSVLPQEDRGPEWWRPTLVLAISFLVGGLWHYCEECHQVLLPAGGFLLILVLFGAYVLFFGVALTWLCLNALGHRIRASLDHRIRMRLATLLARREVWFLPRHSTRESWAGWRQDLESLSRRGASLRWMLAASAPALATVVSSGLPLLVTRGSLGDAPQVDAPQVDALIVGLSLGLLLIATSWLTGRANCKLYEQELKSTLEGLSEEPRDASHLAQYPSSLVIDVIGVTGVVVCSAPVVTALLFATWT